MGPLRARCALDANVLIYSFDHSAPLKRDRALALIGEMEGAGTVVPAQALAEASRVLLVKRRPPLSPDDVAGFIERLATAFTVVPLTEYIVTDAIRGVAAHGFSYFDAQIWAAARAGGATVLLTEDFQDGRDVEGVRIVNPFAPTFDLTAL